MSTLKARHFNLIDDLDIAAITLAAIERIETAGTKVVDVVRLWARRSNDRRLLAMMNQRMLDDIGLSHHQVRSEVAKYFWQQ